LGNLPEKEKVMEIYTIEKGKHYAGCPLKNGFLWGLPFLSFDVYFTASCAYTGDIQTEEQVNKLFGYTTFPFLPHLKSHRIGWRYSQTKGKIELFDYSYRYGKRTITYLHDMALETWETIDIHPLTSKIWGFRLYPYFGGLAPAPHTMTLYLNKRKTF
jgi:hypothetical protein